MTSSLSDFAPIDGLEGVYAAQSKTLRCTALRLRSGGLCLYSPVQGRHDGVRDSLAGLGEVTFLLAPNHFHSRALAEYTQAYPDARLCCSDASRPRLERTTGLVFDGLDALADDLPEGMRMVATEGLKTGEVWISIDAGNMRAWIVTDCLSGPKGAAGSYADTPQMLGTFPKFAVADAALYRAWLDRQLAADPPSLIIPCHGSMVRGGGLAGKIRAVVSAML